MVTEYKTCTYCKQSMPRDDHFYCCTLKTGCQKWSSRCKPCLIKITKATIELRSHGVELGALVELGQRKLG